MLDLLKLIMLALLIDGDLPVILLDLVLDCEELFIEITLAGLAEQQPI